MVFWGVEVKPGQALKVEPGEDKILHLSQAFLGEVKDKGNAIILHVNIDGKKLVVGTLFAGKATHISYDLVFEKDFELSHTGKTGSVYFCGYRSFLPLDINDEKDLYGKPEDNKVKKDNAAKTDSAEAKKVKLVDPKKGKKPVADDDDDDSEEDESDDEEMVDSEDDSDDDSSDEEEATPEEVQQGKKGPAESASKADKKAKLVTPQKSSGGGHTATPYPKGGSLPSSGGDKSKQQSPKSGGQKRIRGGVCHSNKKGKHDGGK